MRLGFIINPVAGMGGKVGLKGTDGDALERALAKGAAPVATQKAAQALSELTPLRDRLEILAAPGVMGAALAASMGFNTIAAGVAAADATSARDTQAAMTAIGDAGADLTLFVGGDGTARDILAACARRDVAVLGAPAGVKMHSGVFAVSARTAGALARRFLTASNREAMLRSVDIVDRPATEDGGYREPQPFGTLRTPYAPLATPPPKAASPFAVEDAVEGACRELAARARKGETLMIGPGAAMQAVKQRLCDAPGTLLGVDAFRDGRLIARDANRDALLALAADGPARIVVSPTGGQGFLFGRGNQQIDAEVIKAVGVENILIVAPAEKLLALETGALFVDTGDASVNAALSGYAPIVTAPKRRMMFRVVNPDDHLTDD